MDIKTATDQTFAAVNGRWSATTFEHSAKVAICDFVSMDSFQVETASEADAAISARDARYNREAWTPFSTGRAVYTWTDEAVAALPAYTTTTRLYTGIPESILRPAAERVARNLHPADATVTADDVRDGAAEIASDAAEADHYRRLGI